jgi:alpha-beta hydrolase superfamily lysophospholipase
MELRMQAVIRPVPLYPDVDRQAFYLESDGSAFFCWQHFPKSGQVRQHNIILCPPLGHEYTHAHRSFKHLAESLATQGFNVFRFDYHGTGDSPGSDKDENRVQTWIGNICSIANYVKNQYPEQSLSLIGLRLGASLAALATQHIDVDHLILWEPIIKGSRYVRVLTALARLAANDASPSAIQVESAGFVMATQTLADIKNINLTKQTITVRKSALVIHRDDRKSDQQAIEKLSLASEQITETYLPGYADMVEEPQETKIPFEAIQFISQWLIANSNAALSLGLPIANVKSSIVFPLKNNVFIEERPCWYKPEDFLFGIISTLKSDYDKNLPTVILLNSGSVHHVGPNRLYVDIARMLAAKGHCVLRLDLEGIGDSATAIPTRENHPYQPNAVANTFAAMDYLQASGFGDGFIIGGICSGAYTAFHCALSEYERSQSSQRIKTTLLINPLTFYWKEGMSLSTRQDETQTIRDKNLYKQSVRDPNKWLKLISGKVSFRYLLQFMFSFLKFRLQMLTSAFTVIFIDSKNPLSMDFDKLVKRKLPVHFIFSSTDPGLDLIKKDAQQSLSKGLTEQVFDIALIENADHTFSQESMRENLFFHLHSIFNRIAKNSGDL